MWVLPVREVLKLTKIETHEEMMQRGVLRQWHEGMGDVLFISHTWLGWHHPDPNGVKITLLVGLHYRVGEWFEIPRGSFFPEPNVDSGCIELLRRDDPLLPPSQYGNYKRIVKRGFSERRKKMMKLLKHDWPAEAVAAVFETLGLDEQIRAEKVSLEQFVELTQLLTQAQPND